MLPWILAHLGVANVGSAAGVVPDTVRYSFDIGAIVLLGAILWTVLTTREYPPAVLHGFADATPLSEGVEPGGSSNAAARGMLWITCGFVGGLLIWHFGLDRLLYVLAGMVTAWGLLLLGSGALHEGMLAALVVDIDHMPRRMRELVPVQFFSWLALFAMWTQTTAAVTQVHFGTHDTASAAYNEGANWVGVLFAAYNGFAALAAIVIPFIVRRFGMQVAHLFNLCLGGAGLLSFLVIRDPDWLLLSMLGVGFAWASILSLPYALLAGSVPSRKMGVYMGIFNFFIVIPQLVIAALTKSLLQHAFHGQSIYVLMVGGASMLLAGLLALRVK
jgi:maltose/moltooligosaccharide transporter